MTMCPFRMTETKEQTQIKTQCSQTCHYSKYPFIRTDQKPCKKEEHKNKPCNLFQFFQIAQKAGKHRPAEKSEILFKYREQSFPVLYSIFIFFLFISVSGFVKMTLRIFYIAALVKTKKRKEIMPATKQKAQGLKGERNSTLMHLLKYVIFYVKYLHM